MSEGERMPAARPMLRFAIPPAQAGPGSNGMRRASHNATCGRLPRAPAKATGGRLLGAAQPVRRARGKGVPAELAVERRPVEAEHPRGLSLVPVDGVEDAQDVPAFELVERHQLARNVRRDAHVAPGTRAYLLRELVGLDLLAARQGDGVLDAVLELAHVSGP